jgi:hypothetical protein
MSPALQPLELDFRRRAGGSRYAGAALLVIGLVFAVDLGVSQQSLRQAVLDKERRLAPLERNNAAKRAAPGARASSTAELAAARETVARLSTPWDNLFGALEAAAGERVALLAIEPDPMSGSALIHAAAADYLAALNYVLELQRASTLEKVRLVKHELRPKGPPGLVAFTVSASWGKPK